MRDLSPGVATVQGDLGKTRLMRCSGPERGLKGDAAIRFQVVAVFQHTLQIRQKSTVINLQARRGGGDFKLCSV